MIEKILDWNDAQIKVLFEYTPPYRGFRDAMGLPTEPPEPAEIDIWAIFFNGIDVIDLFSHGDLIEVEDRLLEE